MNSVEKRNLYQSFFNGWKVAGEKEFIDELEYLCIIQDWEYNRSEYIIELIRKEI